MAYTTDFIGHVEVRPGLNEAELAYLAAFTGSRRWRRPDGPYAVPIVGYETEPAASRAWHLPAEGQPSLWCDWLPCWDGCCLTWQGEERFAGVGTWLGYLVDHFLRAGAQASRGGDPRFAGFTFDHVLDGMVVGCRRDNKQLFAVSVHENRVREEILRPGDRRLRRMPPLPYEELADGRRTAGRPASSAPPAAVLPFTGAPGSTRPEGRRPGTSAAR